MVKAGKDDSPASEVVSYVKTSYGVHIQISERENGYLLAGHVVDYDDWEEYVEGGRHFNTLRAAKIAGTRWYDKKIEECRERMLERSFQW